MLKSFWKIIFSHQSDVQFLKIIHLVERLVSKILSIALLVVIAVAIYDLMYLLIQDITNDPAGFYNQSIIELFGLFLNILIALELLENVTAYLKRNIIHVELVITTALIAVARKIIIFDFAKQNSTDMVAIAIGILALSISYWLVKKMKAKKE